MISRPSRAVRVDVDALELEGRVLLSALPRGRAVATTPTTPILPSVQFIGTSTPGSSQVAQVVTQQAGTATVQLSGMSNIGPFEVEVKTDPSSPAVGMNVGAVDQTVMFPEGHSEASLSVPILAGAPNPGEVDVTLTATPINAPGVTSSGPLVLRILASDASIPPTITTEQGTPQGIVLTFSKPMDPASAANVQNYDVRAISGHVNHLASGIASLLDHFVPYGPSTVISFAPKSVPLRAAVYDPATNSVTLIPKRRLNYSAQITVSQGSGSKKSSRPRHPSDAPLGLTDVEGNPINGDSTPGKFGLSVSREARSALGVTVYGVG